MTMNKNIADMLLSDILYDKTSLVFENGILNKIADPMDSNDLPEGRSGEFPCKRIKINCGITLFVPLTRKSRSFKDAKPSTDTESSFCLLTDNRYLSVEKRTSADAHKLIDAYNSSKSFVQGSSNNPNTTEWLGFLSGNDGKSMLGIVRLIAASDGRMFFVTYAGTGNFTDIRLEMNELLDPLYMRLIR